MRYLAGLLIIFYMISCSQEKQPLILSPLFSDGMVVQQKEPITIWGQSVAGAKITAEGSWGKTGEVTAQDANWKLQLDAPEAGGPFELTIHTKDTTITIHDVYSGEVWLASGQSNMEWILANSEGAEAEMAAADFPAIRMFTVAKRLSLKETKDLKGSWQICKPGNVDEFSAIGYYFAKDLHQKLGVPIGIIHTSWGGTPAESWVSSSALRELKDFDDTLNDMDSVSQDSSIIDGWIGKMKKASIENKEVYEVDLGDEQLAKADYDDAAWGTMTLPTLWERASIGNLDGIVWFRKDVTIEQEPKGDYVLNLGPIDDMDITYVNGREVGRTVGSSTYQIKRSYKIPAGVLMKGKNLIAVKVIDGQGGGGIYGDPALLKLEGDGKTLSLAGEWKFLPTAHYFNGDLYLFDFGNELFSQKPVALDLMDPYTPSILYNGMIAPVIDYTFKGAIWYQGESNVGRAKQYLKLFPALIEDWREQSGNESFPFYYVQIAPYQYAEGGTASADIREAQRRTMEVSKNTGMAVTLDIGNVKDIHPRNKKDVGARLSRWALHNDYGKDIMASGPLYKSKEVEGNKLKIHFDYAGEGLVLKDTKSKAFEVAGEDGVYFPAVAMLNNDVLELTSPNVKVPENARYAWSDIAEATLFNKEGLPAATFSTSW